MMDFEDLVVKQSQSEYDDSNFASNDDSNFASMRDNDSMVPEDSDDDYLTLSNRPTRKRMQTFDDNYSRKVRKNFSTSSIANKIEKLPTRRPDPNVRNRNAIMARENRRKKKQHVDKLENQLEQNRQEMERLMRIIKERDRTVEKLTNEALYLRSVIANKTEIMTLVKTIKGNKLPVTSSVLSFVAEDDHSPTTCRSTDEELENDFDLGFCTSSTSSDDLAVGNWRSFLNDEDNSCMLSKSACIPALPQTDTKLSCNGNNNHNYYLNNNTDAIKRKDRDGIVSPGICLHLAGGRISLEFCAACHSSSQNAWIEEL